MKVKKDKDFFEMKSELDILNFGGHDYLLTASALPLDDQLFQSQFNILGKTDIFTFYYFINFMLLSIIRYSTVSHSLNNKLKERKK